MVLLFLPLLNMQAVGVLEAAKALNRSVSEDLSVIGFDGIEAGENERREKEKGGK